MAAADDWAASIGSPLGSSSYVNRIGFSLYDQDGRLAFEVVLVVAIILDYEFTFRIGHAAGGFFVD